MSNFAEVLYSWNNNAIKVRPPLEDLDWNHFLIKGMPKTSYKIQNPKMALARHAT